MGDQVFSDIIFAITEVCQVAISLGKLLQKINIVNFINIDFVTHLWYWNVIKCNI